MSSHKILNISIPDPKLQDKLSSSLGISRITSQILINRGIKSLKEAGNFLDPRLDQLLDPFSFSDMRLAVNLIKKSARNKDRVLVHGDYDVDGVTSLVLLTQTLRKLGLEAEHYIPHRIKEGYGLGRNIIKILKEKKIGLFITADCGTNSVEIIEEIKGQGIEVIITDHHEPSTTASYGWPVINPKISGSGYKYRDLAGVGVAFKLCQALTGSFLEDDLDLVCLGTICDSVPLTGENRVISKLGLEKIAESERPGLKALIQAAGINNKKMTQEFVGFILGPRINASGRMDTAETAFDLLMCDDEIKAAHLAKTLDTYNRQRQKVESEIMEEAQDLINKEVNFKEHQVMVVAKEGWHLGVLGVVASKLADRFYRPAILISINQGLCRGSGRSIKNFHLFEGLNDSKELLDGFGGHEHAIGMVIQQDNISQFRDKINLFAKDKLVFQDLIPSLDVDMELGLADIGREFILELGKLEPFGEGNARPLFYTRDLMLKGQPRLFNKNTMKFWVTDNDLTYSAIGFGMGQLKGELLNAGSFGLVYSPMIDNWQGQESMILDIKEIFFKTR
ncbi:MAG: single-stranded-DNA-specific exonuclease RecJ [Candidatus Omnitrophica bacterium]|jgi:single-stranded-DNA-specific exonuclease|nr:single-stranded-DNA-specific exonuclease RecJ [Candidatus Omnitrophota bacterium]MDD5079850.1 single-stranded-DNA-specific exonuclease RecJ [Candidatus Omnitrophota bacterium]